MADSLYTRPLDNIANTGSLTADAGTPDATYGLSALYDGSLTSPLKITPAAGVAVLKWDFGGSPRQLLAIVIANHNIPSTASFIVQANATDSWGGPSYSQAFSLTSPDADGIGRTNWLSPAAGSAYRFWRVGLASGAPSPTVIGEILLSETARSWPALGAEFQHGGVHVSEVRPQVAQYSAGGAAHVSPDPTKVALYEGFVRGTYTQLESYREWYGYALGMAKPFPIYIPTLGRADVVRFDQFDLRRDHLNGQLWDLSLRLRSESHGPGW